MIIFFGSINYDTSLYVHKFITESGMVKAQGFHHSLGGKGMGQALAALTFAHEPVRFYCAVGDDKEGEQLKTWVQKTGLDTQHIQTISDARTGQAWILINNEGRNIIALAAGANMKADQEAISSNILNPDALVCMQMEVDAKQNQRFIERAHSEHCGLVLNAAPLWHAVDIDTLAKLDVLILNHVEAISLVRSLGLNLTNYEDICRHFARVCGIICVITLAAKGAVMAIAPEFFLPRMYHNYRAKRLISHTRSATGGALPWAQQGFWRMNALVDSGKNPIDTTGAGDVFVGTFVGLLTAFGPAEALRRSVIAASTACIERGKRKDKTRSKQIDRYDETDRDTDTDVHSRQTTAPLSDVYPISGAYFRDMAESRWRDPATYSFLQCAPWR